MWLSVTRRTFDKLSGFSWPTVSKSLDVIEDMKAICPTPFYLAVTLKENYVVASFRQVMHEAIVALVKSVVLGPLAPG